LFHSIENSILESSWSQGTASTGLHDVILEAQKNDILFVAIAGNNNSLFGGQNLDTYPVFQGGYGNSSLYPELTNVLTVATTDQKDGLPGWSNYGAKSVHLGAPGVNILSTWSTDNTAYLSGTSMAAPHVSGAATLILSAPAASGYTTAQLRSAILNG
jgi:subtilisin family serine protease